MPARPHAARRSETSGGRQSPAVQLAPPPHTIPATPPAGTQSCSRHHPHPVTAARRRKSQLPAEGPCLQRSEKFFQFRQFSRLLPLKRLDSLDFFSESFLAFNPGNGQKN